MVQIGNNNLPGVVTTVDSATSTGVNVDSAAGIGLVGQADLESGTANANETYTVRTPVKARSLFGAGSILAENVVAALAGGAYPVFAVAAEEIDVNDEDISGLASASGTLDNAPVTEDASALTVTVDGTDLSVVKTYTDPSTETVGAEEVFYNPVNGDFELDAAPTTSGTVTYSYYDYPAAVDALRAGAGDDVDFLGVTNENDAVVSDAHDEVQDMEASYQFAVVVAGAAARISDTSTFEHEYDSSRLQLLYPGRDADDMPLIGAYLGMRARIGIDQSPMFKRLAVSSLSETLSESDKVNLLSAKVTPLSDESAGAKVVEDVSTTSESNTEEAEMAQTFHRLVVDYCTEIVSTVSERFIGKLHTVASRNAMRSIIVNRLGNLRATSAIRNYTVVVTEEDSMTANVDVGIETVDPLRNVNANIVAGNVLNSGALA